MLTTTGVADRSLVEHALPSLPRRKERPYPVIECFMEIPCNPCSTSCPFHAIQPMQSIHDLPVVDFEKCTGCGICAGVCPGLAIFIVDETRDDGTGSVTIPYEFCPLPQKGDTVATMDRAGNVIGEGIVSRVKNSKATKTPLVTLDVPIHQVHDVRFFSIKKSNHLPSDSEPESASAADVEQRDTARVPFDGSAAENTVKTEKLSSPAHDEDDEVILCRCEGITLREIRDLIREGYTTVDEIKRICRAGMGPCQGRTCGPLIEGEIARMTGTPRERVMPSTHRPPVIPKPIGFFKKGGDDE